MLKLLSVFLLILSACSHQPTTKFDGQWEFCASSTGETMACLSQPDVKKLRELLIRCEVPK